MCLYGHIIDREWLSLLFSYFGLVNCMDKRCHEIVYKKLWPNMDSQLRICTMLTDFRVYRHIPTHLHYDRWFHTTPWNWLKKHDCVPNLLVFVHHQMLACHLMNPLITTELLFLLSSQGGYTMAYCQKEIRWRRVLTQMVLYFEGVAVPTADLQLPILWAHVATLVEISRVWAGCAASFPWAALGSEDQERGPVQHPVLPLVWPSRKEVYKCRHPKQQTFKKMNWIPAAVTMGAFGKWQRHTAALLLGGRLLEWQPLFLRMKGVPSKFSLRKKSRILRRDCSK